MAHPFFSRFPSARYALHGTDIRPAAVKPAKKPSKRKLRRLRAAKRTKRAHGRTGLNWECLCIEALALLKRALREAFAGELFGARRLGILHHAKQQLQSQHPSEVDIRATVSPLAQELLPLVEDFLSRPCPPQKRFQLIAGRYAMLALTEPNLSLADSHLALARGNWSVYCQRAKRK